MKKFKFESITQFNILENKIKFLESRIADLEKIIAVKDNENIIIKLGCPSLPSENNLSDFKDFHKACLIKSSSVTSWDDSP